MLEETAKRIWPRFKEEYFLDDGIDDNLAELNVAGCRCFRAEHTIRKLVDGGGTILSVSVDGDLVTCDTHGHSLVEALQFLCKREIELVGSVIRWKGRTFDALASPSAEDRDAFIIEFVHTPRPLLVSGAGEERNYAVFTDFLSLGIEVYIASRARALGIYCSDVYKGSDPATWQDGIVVFPQ